MKVPSQKRIYRDLDSGIISGVCAGVARYFDIDAVWVRAAAVAGLFIATPITLVAYIAAVILLPRLGRVDLSRIIFEQHGKGL